MRQNLFRAKLAENGLSQKDVAKELGMAENTLTHKIREKFFWCEWCKENVKIAELK